MLLQSTAKAPQIPWSFRCYVSSTGRNEFEKWHRSLSPTGRAKLATRLRYLREQPAERWRRPDAVALKNHVCVIHFQDENRKQHRITGYFDIEHHAFVMCVIGFEKDDEYHPSDYEEKANACRASVGTRFGERTVGWPWPIR